MAGDPIRVLQIHNLYRRPGGEDAVARTDAEIMRYGGHTVDELVVRNPDGGAQAAVAMGKSSWNRQSAEMVREKAAAGAYQLAHVYNTWFTLTFSIFSALRSVGLKTVFTVQNYRLACTNGLLLRDGRPCELCVGSHPWHGVIHRCYRESAASSAVVALNIERHRRRGTLQRDVDRILVPTEFARRKLIESDAPADRIAVRSNCVSDPGPRPDPPARSKDVLFVGRLSAEKGVIDLIEGWRAYDPPDLTLTVLGDGPLRGAMERSAPSSVRFVGHVPEDEVVARMHKARALVFPSIWYEGQPMVLLQALAAGLPVIGTQIGGVGETLAPLGTSWLYGPGDRPALLDRLRRLHDDSALDTAGERARRIYEERYSLRIGALTLERAYDAVLNRSAGR